MNGAMGFPCFLQFDCCINIKGEPMAPLLLHSFVTYILEMCGHSAIDLPELLIIQGALVLPLLLLSDVLYDAERISGSGIRGRENVIRCCLTK